jgi:hypothetical protein
LPVVLRWGPYRAFFYSNERDEPAHVHVKAGDKEAKFWLHDLGIAINAGFRQLGPIIRHLRQHRDEVMDRWNEHFGD